MGKRIEKAKVDITFVKNKIIILCYVMETTVQETPENASDTLLTLVKNNTFVSFQTADASLPTI